MRHKNTIGYMLKSLAGNQTKRFRFAYEAKAFLGVKYSVFNWALTTNTPINGWSIHRLVSTLPSNVAPVTAPVSVSKQTNHQKVTVLFNNAPVVKKQTNNAILADMIGGFLHNIPEKLKGKMLAHSIAASYEKWWLKQYGSFADFGQYTLFRRAKHAYELWITGQL